MKNFIDILYSLKNDTTFYKPIRESFGHWEIDTVIGTKKSQKALLVSTERKTRREIIKSLETRTSDATVKALDKIKHSFSEKRLP